VAKLLEPDQHFPFFWLTRHGPDRQMPNHGQKLFQSDRNKADPGIVNITAACVAIETG
jgi:hypothetical protein